jgi:uncharacterized protein
MTSFNLEVSVTEKCNLACPYCYVANVPKFLSTDAFDEAYPKILELVERSNKGAHMNPKGEYHVDFFGGEPLLNMKLIKHATKKFQEDPQCLHVGIISNLSLITDEIADWVIENDVGVSWSFDGITSNESRPLVKNMEENDDFENVLDMYNAKRGLLEKVLRGDRHCKLMLFPGNIENMTENLEFLMEMGIYQPDFMCVRDDIWSKEDLQVFRVECRRLANRVIDYFDEGRIIIVGMFHLAIRDVLIGMTKMKRPWGCFAGTHGAILSVDGEFYPCARFASKKLLPMSGEEYNFEYWQDKLNPRQYDKCKSCKLYKVCNAGCSYSQIRNNNEPIDSVCEINHIFFDETLRIAEKCKHMPAYKEYVRNVFTGQWDEKMMPQNANIKDIKESIKIAAYGSEALPYKEVAVYG